MTRPTPAAMVHMACMLADLCECHGIPFAPLLEGLTIGSSDLAYPWRWMPWSDLATLIDRVMAACGDPFAFEAACADTLPRTVPMRVAASLVVSPMDLYLVVSQRLARRCYRGLGIRFDREGDQVHLRHEIPEGEPGSLGFAYGTLGLLRAYPRLLGLPDAHVQGELGAHRVHFVVTPPDSRTIGARFAGWVGMRREAELRLRPGELENCLAMFHDASALVERVSDVGSALPFTGLAAFWEGLRQVLAEEFCCYRARCFRDAAGTRVLVGSVGDLGEAQGRMTMLVVSGQRVGELWTDLSEAEPMLPLLVPWVAAALQSAVRAEQGQTRYAVPEADRSAWRLTTRQGQVLELLVQGCTNKEVATALQCSPRTVDVIVSQLLERTSSPNRSSLVARYWSGRR